jgi:cysteine desulfurase/selenocysteine lyase
VLAIQADFPILAQRSHGRPLVYLDSAATSLKPRQVIDAERRYATEYSANVHRGKHRLSEEASDAYEDARQKIARHINVESPTVIFVRNATEAINVVARGIGLRKTDKVVVPIGEHHSNMIPWMREATVCWMEQALDRSIDIDLFSKILDRERPRVAAFSYVSNVSGAVNPVIELCKMARDRGVVTVLDASQAVPHVNIDTAKIGCDFLAFSGHKMFGPVGTGVLSGRREVLERLQPLMIGGGTVEKVTVDGFVLRALPYRLEAGTPNVSGAVGLAAACEYIEKLTYGELHSHLSAIDSRLNELFEENGINTLRSQAPRIAPITSLWFEETAIHADNVAIALSDNFNVMVRSGFFCAHPLLQKFVANGGLVRVSPHAYNSLKDVELFFDALTAVRRRFLVSQGSH